MERRPCISVRLDEVDKLARTEAGRIGMTMGAWVKAIVRRHLGLPAPDTPFDEDRLVLPCYFCGAVLTEVEIEYAKEAEPDEHASCLKCVPEEE